MALEDATLYDLRIFKTACETGSMKKTAEEYGIAQPTVSSALRRLEEIYGENLVKRSNRGIETTQAGEKLLGYTAGILYYYEKSREELGENGHQVFRLGVSFVLGEAQLPELLSHIQKELPQAGIRIVVDNIPTIRRLLYENKLDWAILDSNAVERGFQAEPVFSDHLYPVCGADFPCAKQLTLEEFAKLPLIAREEGSGNRSLVQELLRKENLFAEPIVESSSNLAILELLRENLGVAVLSEAVLDTVPDPESFRELEIEGVDFVRQYYLVYNGFDRETELGSRVRKSLKKWLRGV